MKTRKRRKDKYDLVASEGAAWREKYSLGKRTTRSDGEIAKFHNPDFPLQCSQPITGTPTITVIIFVSISYHTLNNT